MRAGVAVAAPQGEAGRRAGHNAGALRPHAHRGDGQAAQVGLLGGYIKGLGVIIQHLGLHGGLRGFMTSLTQQFAPIPNVLRATGGLSTSQPARCCL